MIDQVWRDVLAQAGVTVETVDATHVRLRHGGSSKIVLLREFRRPLHSSQLPPAPNEPTLLVLPRATQRMIDAAVRDGWYVVTDTGALAVRLGTHLLERHPRSTAAEGPARTRGPASWATFAIARRLLAAPAMTQRELAERCGLSQSRVSRLASRLVNAGLVEQTAGQWRPSDWDTLLDWWLRTYPGAAGTASYWYSLDDPATQTVKALTVLQTAPAAHPVISGDVAADLLAPWRRPTSTIIYTKIGAPLENAGFIAVGTPDKASLALRAPADPGVWLPTPWIVGDHLAVADPLQVLHDLTVVPGSDRTEAAHLLREALRTTHRISWQQAVTGA
jgi:hypothetical protein